MKNNLLNHKYSIGIKNYNAKLTENQVLEIRALYKKSASIKNLAKLYNINRTTISSIVRCKTWKHVGDTKNE